jgi:hypothetical protein
MNAPNPLRPIDSTRQGARLLLSSRDPMTTSRTLHLSLVAALLALPLVAGCGSDGRTPGFDGVNVELPPPEPFAVGGGDACFVDSECAVGTFCFQQRCVFECETDTDCGGSEVCDARRRCSDDTDPAGSASAALTVGSTSATLVGALPKAIDTIVPGVGIGNLAQTNYEIAPGQTVVNVVIEATEPVAEGEIGYALTRYDSVLNAFQPDPRLYRATGTTTFQIPIPTGNADPDSSTPGNVRVDLVTGIGAFSVSLIPRASVAGRYAGTVRMDELAGAALPIDMEIVTDPPGAALAAATSAWLLLPVREDTLFSPHAVGTFGPDAVAAPLSFDAFTQRWVALYEHSFTLAADGPFGDLPADGVRRTLRAEIEVSDRRLTGRLSDRWTGLFDERTAAGVRSPGDVVFQGDLDLPRVGDGREVGGLPTPATLPAPAPGPRAVPALTICDQSAVDLGATPAIDVGGTVYSCAGIATTAAFAASVDRAAQMSCAIAVAENALAGDTVASQIASFVAGTASGQSFSDFIEACAAGTNGTCVPAGEILCGRQLLARAYADLDINSATAPQVVASYRAANREANLGPQLAAFHVDTQTRLDWLQSQNFPAVVTSAVQGLNESLLDDWRTNVLEVHLAVLGEQFSSASLAVLGRGSDDLTIRDARGLMLLELAQGWRASADALGLAASRWSDLYQDMTSRSESARYVREQLFDLYVMSGVMAELNRLAGAGFASAGLAGGFSVVASELQELSQPFSSLVFARDAEIVVSTSLDPTMNNDTVLSGRRATAMTELTRAATSVTSTLSDLQRDLVDEATLRGRLQTQTGELYAELVELCGLPVGCALADRADPDCRPRVEPGECGFALSRTTGDIVGLVAQQPSEASAAVLSYWEALQNVEVARAELNAQSQSVSRYRQLTNAFHRRLLNWDQRRQDTDDEITVLTNEALARNEEATADLADYVTMGIAIRTAAATERNAWLAEWNTYADEVNGDVETLFEASRTASAAAGLQITADTFLIGSDALFGGAGAGSAGPQIGLAVAGAATAGVGAAFNIAAGVTQANADYLEREVAANALGRDFALSFMDFQMSLQTAEREDQLATLEADMEALATNNAFADGILEILVDNLEGALADELALERDLAELADRRVELNDRFGELNALRQRVAQAQLTVDQRLLNYYQVLQRAQLLDARLNALETQESEINELLGSPAVVFGWANRLSQAESRLERAKAAMMEWLVTLEYLAVRPFMDQRIQILLARNTFQLEDIAAELDRLQSACGGAQNATQISVSVRRDLLNIERGIVDEATSETLTPEQRFRAILAEAVVPIDKRVRYTTDSNIGDVVSRGGILAVTFDINLTDFANLAASCNAKISSVAIELVGEGLGSARPTVSLLYDGSSSVRSCQPNIQSIVDSIGRSATTFGPITTFRATGRSVSPVAGINAPGGTNETLRGLPLASQYTLLIDPMLGENGNIDWDALDDVVLHLDYVSQDVFPVGQCQ